jgi:hypothetical protein
VGHLVRQRWLLAQARGGTSAREHTTDSGIEVSQGIRGVVETDFDPIEPDNRYSEEEHCSYTCNPLREVILLLWRGLLVCW